MLETIWTVNFTGKALISQYMVFTRAGGKMENIMEMAYTCGQMEEFTRSNMKMANLMDKADTSGQMELFTKAIFKMA